jgi:hypothetical protein
MQPKADLSNRQLLLHFQYLIYYPCSKKPNV